MELVRAVPVVLLAGGIGFLAWAAATGGAAAGVFVIFPFVLGTGPLALLGGLLVALGLLTLPLALPAGSIAVAERHLPTGDAASSGFGGVALLGPVPIFFGSWRSPQRWVYWAAVALGLVLLLAVVFGTVLLLR